ncbi:MAG: phosphohydrolase, partial [Burkholderiaceae bacterium]
IQLAARQLFQEERGGPLATGMIKALGLYPPGDLVQLKNGEIAVVVRRGQTATTPLVASLTNAQGMPVATTTLRDTTRLEFAITGAAGERKGLSRVLPERVYGLMN